jgi:hypothetical protein
MDPQPVETKPSELSRWRAWAVPAAFWAAGPLLGLIFSCKNEWAPHDQTSFFEVCGLVEPIIGLAVFVELVLVLGQVVNHQGPTLANQQLVRAIVRANAGLFFVSQGAALYAIGSESTSPFLLFSATVPIAIQIYLLVDCAYQRVGISRIRGG